jgi:hypothetical protein
MPHRRILLRDLAPQLMFQDPGTKAYLKARVAEWESQAPEAEEEKLRFQVFLARFRPENCQLTPHGGGILEIKPTLPEAVERKRQISQAESELRLLSHGMALRARRLLDREQIISKQELPGFFELVKRLQQPEYPDRTPSDSQYRLQSLAGGLAVMFINHRNWLSENPSQEQWSFEALKNFPSTVNDENYGPESGDAGHNSETFLGEIGIFLLQERGDEWIRRIAFDGVTGFYYGSTLYSMWRAYLCREKLGETFDELISTFLFWSALRRAAIREGGYHSQISALPKCRATLYTRFLNGRLREKPATITQVITLGARLVERIARRDPSEIARRHWQKERNALETSQRDRDVSREMPNLDLQVIQYGFCFLSDSLRSGRASDWTWAERRIPELFELEMQTLPLLEGDDEGREIGGTAYPFDIWVMQRAAELIASLNSLEQARPFFESILGRGPSAMYWTQDFLQAWITHALPLSKDHSTFAAIWKAMIEYARSLPAWKPTAPGYYCPAESLAVDLMGLRDTAVKVLGRQEYRDLVKDMAPTFRRWGDEWLKFASVAAWFAHFLSTESGQAVLSQGIQQLATVVSSFSDRDWERDALAPTLSSALGGACKHLSSEIETDKLLRSAFLHLLTELCSRSIPEAIHLRDRVSHIFTIG